MDVVGILPVKFEHSIERSAEHLRMALPLMSRQLSALHPVSYAVWYCYVSGESPELRQAVDQHLARHGQLDESATQALFCRHVAEVDPQTAQRVADGFQKVLSGMAESAALTVAMASAYQARAKKAEQKK